MPMPAIRTQRGQSLGLIGVRWVVSGGHGGTTEYGRRRVNVVPTREAGNRKFLFRSKPRSRTIGNRSRRCDPPGEPLCPWRTVK
jgi:hypothetical protein